MDTEQEKLQSAGCAVVVILAGTVCFPSGQRDWQKRTGAPRAKDRFGEEQSGPRAWSSEDEALRGGATAGHRDSRIAWKASPRGFFWPGGITRTCAGCGWWRAWSRGPPRGAPVEARRHRPTYPGKEEGERKEKTPAHVEHGHTATAGTASHTQLPPPPEARPQKSTQPRMHAKNIRRHRHFSRAKDATTLTICLP